MTESNPVSWENSIYLEPQSLGGLPYIKGTSITVSDVLEELSRTMSVRRLRKEFPELNDKQIAAALACAAHAFEWEEDSNDRPDTGDDD